MGFNKRFVKRSAIILRWKEGGIDSVHRYLNADALIVNPDAYDLIEAYNKGDFNKFKELIDSDPSKD